MGRRKIEIKAIKDDRNRSVTFLKRKGGLFKKAHELSVLCSVDVAVIIFGHNKKLYEYSSGDINDTIGRFQYYGSAHEHKGPADFDGGAMDDEDEDDMGSPPMDNVLPREQSLPPHLQNQSFMRTAASASPPMPNGLSNGAQMYPRQGTPSAQMGSRPGSRNAARRSSSNLGPSHLQQVSQPPQTANGYAYMRTPPSIYTPPTGGMPGPHHRQHSSGQVQYYNQLQQVANSQVQQAYLQDQRRQSLSNSYAHSESQQQQAHIPSPPQTDSEQRPQDEQRLIKPIPTAKSRSIFTPVDDSRSLLAAHWGGSKAANPAREEIKQEKEEHVDANPVKHSPNQAAQNTSPPPPPSREAPPTRRSESTDFLAPSRSDSQAGVKRPRLKVQIPEEQSETGSPTSETSQRQSGHGEIPAKGSAEANHASVTGVVLPPPSPSASALLSAGAQGPPNPFARPAPPPMGSQQRDNMETPISALPSRFVADGLLPSPSSFYPEWSYGRSGGDSANILPSPLNFPMPIPSVSGPGRDEDAEKKRKSPEAETPQVESMKRVKT